MATGFVERYKGKYTADPNSTRIAGVPMYGSATQLTFTPTSTGSTVTIPNITVARINASSTTAFIRLPQITFIGQPMAIEVFGVGSTSTAIFISATPSSVAGFIGSSFNTIKSTGSFTMELQATSSINWAIMGVFSTGTSTGGSVNQSFSFSTTT